MKKIVDVSETVLVELTEEEVKAHAMELVTLLSEVDQVEREMEAEKAQWKATINEVKGKVERKRGIIADKKEPRKVSCKRVYETEKGLTHLLYNGKKYHERCISEREMELLRPNLFDEEPDVEELQSESDNTQKPRGKGRSLKSVGA